jgi:hypothetical protein
MKKLLLLVIVCLQCSIYTFAQSQNNDIIKCINSLEKGDMVQFGPASGHFNYYTYTKKDAGFGKGLNVELIKDDDLISKKYIIKNLFITYDYVKKEFYTETKQIISFGKKGGVFGVTYYADIYGALESGEIIIQKCQIQKEKSE